MITSLGLQQTPKANGICLDISLLQAADSFLNPPRNGGDPRSALCFSQVTTAFCNGASLFAPLPLADGGQPPPILEFWRKARGVDFLPHSELSDKELDCYGDQLTESFVEYAEQNADELARWVRFQYSPDINEQYIDRAGNRPIERAVPYMSQMLLERRLPKLEAAIQAEVGVELPRAFRVYLPFESNPVRTSISYLFSVFARGLSYAERCAQVGIDLPYSHIWFRNRAVQIGARASQPIGQRGWYPWGLVLSQLFDPLDDITSRDTTHIQETLLAIREDVESGRFSPIHYASASDGSDPGDVEDSPLIVAALKTLTRAGITLKYANSRREAVLRALLTGAAILASALYPEYRLMPPCAGFATVLLDLAKPKMASMEAKLRLQFAADTFWNVFERDKRLLSAVSIAAAEWRNSRHTQ